jgi:hypothetical protein
MSNKTNFNFVEYLDNYKSKRQCRYLEYIKMIGLINENYEYNNIFYPGAWDPTPYDGAMICGQRTYTVTGTTGCSTMLTVTNIGN